MQRGMVVGDEAAAHGRGEEGHAEAFGKLLEFGDGLGPADALSDDHQGGLGVEEEVGGFLHEFGVASRLSGTVVGFGEGNFLLVGLGEEDVLREVKVDGAGASRGGGADAAGDEVGYAGGAVDDLRPLG